MVEKCRGFQWTASMEEDREGEYVLAQDAYDKVSVLEAEITTLKAQLKDAKREVAAFKPSGASVQGRIFYTKQTARE
jgi:ethanolamine utilization protein EutP (predicted NTPase)